MANVSFKRNSSLITVLLTALILLLQLILAVSSLASSLEGHQKCNGSVAECNEEEMLMESEISHRFLAQNHKVIGYGFLKPNQPVCGGAGNGKPYSGSCLPPPSNPNRRGCSSVATLK